MKRHFKYLRSKYEHLYKKYSKITKFGTYIFCSGIATIVDFALLYSFTEFLGLWYIFSAALSYFAGMLTNYPMNKIITFRNKSKKIIRQFGLFAFVSLIGLALNLIIIYALVEWIGLWYMLAKAVATLIVLVWSYTGHKHITFGFLK
ncbi:MAG: GtrA family protein [Candidatus Woesearchaeota archaeon]|nr:GtrA family protein [Candidatus Woesearchaeota archaeon]